MESKSDYEEHEQCIWLKTLMNKIMNDKSIASIIDIKMKRAIPEGDNYGSIIYRVKMTAILRNGQKAKLTVIMKKALENKDKLEAMLEVPAFKVETTVYKEVFQKFEALMNEYQDNNDKLWCNLIGYRPYDLIVLEDLKLKNYVVANRRKMLDLNHSKLVMHSLGRLHSIGYILMQKGLLNKGDLASFFWLTESVMTERLFKCGLIVLSRAIEKYWTSEWKEIGERLYNQHKTVIEKLKQLFVPQENNFITLCHGDCWTSNMMFKYSPCDDNYPVAFKFLDFQTAHINPYIFDVMYVLYASVHPDVRRSNYEQLISIYQKSLQATLTAYGFEDRTPTLDHIHTEAKRIEYYSFISNAIILPLTIAEGKGAFTLEWLNDESKCMEAFSEDLFKADLYKSAVQPELRKWFNKGLF